MKLENLNMKIASAVILLVLAGVKIGAAQGVNTKAPLPDGPLLNKDADFSAWQISYAYESDKLPPASKPPLPKLLYGQLSPFPVRSVTLTRTLPYWHSVTVDIGGISMGQWSDGVIRLYAEGNRPPTLVPIEPSPRFPDFGANSFPDMDWVSATTYLGTETLDGKPCLVFGKNDMKAWINLKTRLPVQWQRGKETRTFQSLPAPGGPITLPPEIAADIASLRHDLHR